MFRVKSLKFKIILSSAVCILTVGVFSNIFLYNYLSGIITEKSDHIDSLVLETVQGQLNLVLDELSSLSMLCAYDLQIARGMRNTKMETVEETRSVIDAQEALQRYLDSFARIGPYVSRLMVFNENGVRAQAVSRDLNRMSDMYDVMESDTFKNFTESGERQMITVAPAIFSKKDSIVCISSVYELPASVQYGWIYIEVSPDFIKDNLAPYSEGSLYVSYEGGKIFPGDLDMSNGEGRVYKSQSVPVNLAGAALFSRTDITFLSPDANAVLFTTTVVIISSLTVALILLVLLGNIITKPFNSLILRLRRIGENDFTRDPLIETGGDEVAEVGKAVNDMAGSIDALLTETEEMYIRQKNSEIALLQSQVNPHFLYNTLDTIRWMAVIQKTPGIEKTVRSLSNLLKNLAKGVGNKITMAEELSLLNDYIDTQSARFMEMFEFEARVPENLLGCLIVKFTLQPLVENAIFHGIEPSGEFGRITVGAEEDGEFILIYVEDSGVGMTAEELAGVENAKPDPAKMSGMGIKNVDERLKLIYGENCGLRYESEPGRFTRVIVRIRKEQACDA